MAGKRKKLDEDDDADDDEEDFEKDEEEEKKPGVVPCHLSLIYTEASVAKRRKLTRGTVSFKQLVAAHTHR